MRNLSFVSVSSFGYGVMVHFPNVTSLKIFVIDMSSHLELNYNVLMV